MSAPRSLLDRRLVIVTGKGGTGKTSVAAALALAAARRGRRVLVAEMGFGDEIPALLSPQSPEPAGYAGRELVPGVTAMHIDPYAALAEYLGLQLGARPLVDLALRNKAFRQLMDAAPGWRELITLGKVWHLEQASEGDGSRWDLIIVDAPATGHGITFLDVPRVVVSAVRAGPLRRHSQAVEEMVRDETRTLLLPVALAEELPARETVELVERVRAELSVAVDRVVVNAVAPPPFPAGLEGLDERLAALPEDADLAGLPPPSTLAACAQHLRARYELNVHYLGEIAEGSALPVVPLPLRPGGIEGPEDVAALAEALIDAEEAA